MFLCDCLLASYWIPGYSLAVSSPLAVAPWSPCRLPCSSLHGFGFLNNSLLSVSFAQRTWTRSWNLNQTICVGQMRLSCHLALTPPKGPVGRRADHVTSPAHGRDRPFLRFKASAKARFRRQAIRAVTKKSSVSPKPLRLRHLPIKLGPNQDFRSEAGVCYDAVRLGRRAGGRISAKAPAIPPEEGLVLPHLARYCKLLLQNHQSRISPNGFMHLLPTICSSPTVFGKGG